MRRDRPAFEKAFFAERAAVTRRLADALRAESPSWEGNLARQAQRYEAWMAERLTAELAPLSRDAAPLAADLVGKAEGRYRRIVEAFRDRLGRNVRDGHGCDHFAGGVGGPSDGRESSPGRRQPGIHDELGAALVDAADGADRRAFSAPPPGLVPWEVEKNLVRLAGEWAGAVDAAAADLRAQAGAWVDAELATLDRLLARRPGEAAAFRRRSGGWRKPALTNDFRRVPARVRGGGRSLRGLPKGFFMPHDPPPPDRAAPPPGTSLNDSQKRAVLFGLLDLHQRMADLEALLTQSLDSSPFSRYVNDLSPTEAKVIRDYFGRLRSRMLFCLQEAGIPLEVRRTSLRWGLQCGMSFLSIAVAEISPSRLRGYGPMDDAGAEVVVKIQQELDLLIDRAAAYLRQGLGRDLPRRLARLEAAPADAADLTLLERVVTRWGLIEFRPARPDRATAGGARFEIAVFGRVSSGKSSLLNHVAGLDVLPVGVTPITAVPTRLVRGDQPAALISFAEVRPRTVAVEELREYASEEGNPGNHKHVTGVLVQLPSPRLRRGDRAGGHAGRRFAGPLRRRGNLRLPAAMRPGGGPDRRGLHAHAGRSGSASSVVRCGRAGPGRSQQGRPADAGRSRTHERLRPRAAPPGVRPGLGGPPGKHGRGR